jgi:large subunit ribosomal protein L35
VAPIRRPQNAQDEDQVERQKALQIHGQRQDQHGQAGKRHGMIKRSNEQIRELRGTSTMSASETQRVKRWMPYG